MKYKKVYYKKIVEWDEKPDYFIYYLGLIVSMSILIMSWILLLRIEDDFLLKVGLLFGWMFAIGLDIFVQSSGKGKKIKYIKCEKEVINKNGNV